MSHRYSSLIGQKNIYLANHKKRFQSFLAFSGTGVISVGAQGHLRASCNKNFCTLTKFCPTTLSGPGSPSVVVPRHIVKL